MAMSQIPTLTCPNLVNQFKEYAISQWDLASLSQKVHGVEFEKKIQLYESSTRALDN